MKFQIPRYKGFKVSIFQISRFQGEDLRVVEDIIKNPGSLLLVLLGGEFRVVISTIILIFSLLI